MSTGQWTDPVRPPGFSRLSVRPEPMVHPQRSRTNQPDWGAFSPTGMISTTPSSVLMTEVYPTTWYFRHLLCKSVPADQPNKTYCCNTGKPHVSLASSDDCLCLGIYTLFSARASCISSREEAVETIFPMSTEARISKGKLMDVVYLLTNNLRFRIQPLAP